MSWIGKRSGGVTSNNSRAPAVHGYATLLDSSTGVR